MKLTSTTFARILRYFLFLGLLVYVASTTSVSNAQAQTVTLFFTAGTISNAEASGFGNVLRVTTSNSATVSAAKTVIVNVIGGTATAADYNRTATITIPAGTAHNSLVSIASGITITDDSLREADETLTLSLASPSSGAALGAQTTTTHTITDDETSYLTQAFGVASISENIGVVTDYMTLVITGTAGGTPTMGVAGSFTYYLVPLGSITPGSDYIDIPQASPITVNVPIGTANGSTFNYSFTIINDSIDEEQYEYFDTRHNTGVYVNFGSPTGNELQITWRITDNDTAGVTVTPTSSSTDVVEGGSTDLFTLQLNSQPESGTVTIGLTSDSQCSVSPTSVTLNSSNWNVGQAIVVTAVNDTASEGAHTCAITTAVTVTDVYGYSTGTAVADVTANVTDNDNGTVKFSAATGSATEGTSPYSTTVTLSLGSTAVLSTAATVQITSTNGTAGASDYGLSTTSVTFPVGSTNGATQTVYTIITNDTSIEGAETFTLNLGTLTGPVVTTSPTSYTVTITDNDTAEVSFSSATGTAPEGTTPYSTTAKLTTTSGGTLASAVTVQITASNGTAGASDYSLTTTSVTFPAGSGNGATQSINTTVTNDVIAEPSETFTLALGTVTGQATVASPTLHSVAITDNDLATITIANVSAAENGTFTFSATLDKATSAAFTVDWSANDVSTSAADFSGGTSGTLSFSGTAGEVKTFTVPVSNDALAEGTEFFIVNLSNFVSASSLTHNISDIAVGTITDNDTATITIENVTAAEDGDFTFSAMLNISTSTSFTVDWLVSNTTTNAADFSDSTSGTLSFAGSAGETKTFTVPVANDAIVEGAESFTVKLNNLVAATAFNSNISDTAVGTITDNDTASITIADVSAAEDGDFTFSATLNADTSAGFTVDWAIAYVSTNGEDFSSTSGILSFSGTADEVKTFTVPVQNDALVESIETFSVGLSNFSTAGGFTVNITDTATGAITDNDTASLVIANVSAAENGDFTFSATLNADTSAGFTVDWAVAHVSTNGEDFGGITSGTLNFSGNMGEVKTFTVPVLDDNTLESTETFGIGLNNFSTGGGFTVNITDTATGTITDNETATVTVSFASAAGTVNEGTSLYTTSVMLAVSDGTLPQDVTVQINASDVSTDSGDYSLTTTSVTFLAGSADGATQTVDVAIANDTFAEGDETFTLMLGTITGEASASEPTSQTVTIMDNDFAAVTTELLVNGGFEEGLTGNWKVQFASGDKRVCITPSKGYNGNCAFKFTGSTTDKSKLIQTVDLTGKTFNAGDMLDVVAFFNGNHASAKINVTLFVYYTGVTQPVKTTLIVRRNAGYVGYGLSTYTLTSGDVSQIKVVFSHLSSGGVMWLDDVSVLHTVPGISALGGSQDGMIAVPDAPADLRGGS